jgi:hypothetical protein
LGNFASTVAAALDAHMAVSANKSNGCRKVAIISPSSQVQFDRRKFRSLNSRP